MSLAKSNKKCEKMLKIIRIEYKGYPFGLLGVYAPKVIVPKIQFSRGLKHRW